MQITYMHLFGLNRFSTRQTALSTCPDKPNTPKKGAHQKQISNFGAQLIPTFGIYEIENISSTRFCNKLFRCLLLNSIGVNNTEADDVPPWD